jgi:hypothetical protein
MDKSQPLPLSQRSRRRKSVDIKLQVTEGFQLPAWYASATPSQCEEALRIGASLYDTVTSAATSQAVTDIEEKKNQEVAKIRTEYDARIEANKSELAAIEVQYAKRQAEWIETQRAKELQIQKDTETSVKAQYESQQQASAREIETIRRDKSRMEEMLETAKREALEQSRRQAEERMRLVQADLATCEERIKVLTASKAMLESDKNRDIQIAEERQKKMFQELLDAKENAILRAEKRNDEMGRIMETLSAETRELHTLLRKKSQQQQNAATKGNQYEDIFRAKLVATYGVDERFSIENSSKGVGHAGDTITRHGEYAILWEFKDYDKAVGTDQIDKFKRDIKENPHVRIGVMVSRNTSIVGKVSRGNLDIEYISGKLHIYLSNFESMSEDTLQFLMLFFRQFWASDSSDAEAGASVVATIRIISGLYEEAKKRKAEWRLHKNHLEETSRWMNDLLLESETKLKNALNVLENNIQTVVAIPSGIFRECDGDEKMLQTCQCILECVEIKEGGSCLMNDLADAVGKRRGCSKDTARTHIRGVLLDSAIDQLPGRAGRVLGMVLKEIIQHVA